MPITASHLGAGLHAAGLSAAISSAAAAGLVGENVTSLIFHLTFYRNSPETNKIITLNNLDDIFSTSYIKRNNDIDSIFDLFFRCRTHWIRKKFHGEITFSFPKTFKVLNNNIT